MRFYIAYILLKQNLLRKKVESGGVMTVVRWGQEGSGGLRNGQVGPGGVVVMLL
jgi:hypothetical protein